MSLETYEWLNLYTLIGYTDRRGNAWHYRQELQGIESNHYVGPVPVDDVLRRLFFFDVIEAPIYYKLPNGDFVPSSVGRKGMLRSDNHFDLGAFREGYQGHPYSEWLLENVAGILDDDLGIGSAGLLRNGAQAWVSVEVPENIVTPEGVEFRPNLLATTSFDGTIATTYKRVRTEVVCDNTRNAALSEKDQEFKVRHTKHSGYKIQDAREALQIVHSMSDEFSAEIAALCARKVTDAQWLNLLQKVVPINDDMKKIGMTKAEKKRAELTQLYFEDDRAAPWHGTAYGVQQAFSTWRQHYGSVRKGVPRQVRNMENLVTGRTGAEDRNIMDVLATIQS